MICVHILKPIPQQETSNAPANVPFLSVSVVYIAVLPLDTGRARARALAFSSVDSADVGSLSDEKTSSEIRRENQLGLVVYPIIISKVLKNHLLQDSSYRQ